MLLGSFIFFRSFHFRKYIFALHTCCLHFTYFCCLVFLLCSPTSQIFLPFHRGFVHVNFQLYHMGVPCSLIRPSMPFSINWFSGHRARGSKGAQCKIEETRLGTTLVYGILLYLSKSSCCRESRSSKCQTCRLQGSLGPWDWDDIEFPPCSIRGGPEGIPPPVPRGLRFRVSGFGFTDLGEGPPTEPRAGA